MATPVPAICLSVTGNVWHTMRVPTSWQAFSDVEAAAAGGDVAFLTDVACAGAATDLHMCAVDGGGGLWHTIRFAQGSWQPFGDVKGDGGTGDPGPVVDVACAAAGSDLHVCALTANGDLWHTIRFPQPPWQPFGDVKRDGGAGNPGAFIDVACAAVGSDLHVCAITADGQLWHTIRFAASWQPFMRVPRASMSAAPRRFVSVSCAVVGADLHVCCVDDIQFGESPGGELERVFGGDLWHTVRKGSENPECSAIRSSIALHQGEIDRLREEQAGLEPGDPEWSGIRGELLEHLRDIGTLRQRAQALECWPAGTPWLLFGNVKTDGGAGDPGPFEDVGCASIDGDLHVCARTFIRRVDLTGGLYHTNRFASGSWQAFADVLAQAGRPWATGMPLNRVGVGTLMVEPPVEPPDDPECTRIRSEIDQRRQTELELIEERNGEDPRTPRGRRRIAQINGTIATLLGEIESLQREAQARGCQ